jgi:hypothetical protein
MKSPATLIAIASAMVGLGVSGLATANDQVANQCSGLAPVLRGVDVIKAIEPMASLYTDAGGYSQATGEHLTGDSAYLIVHVERPDGSMDPAFGQYPRGMLAFRTASGRFVVRFLDIPSNQGRPGAF